MTNEEIKIKAMNHNIKLTPIFFALTWDVFFFWAISTIFLNQIKGLSFSQIVTLDSLGMLFGCLMCIPLTKLFQKVSSLTSAKLAMVGYGLFLLAMIYGTNYFIFVLGRLFLAFGYCINSVKINSFITDTLSQAKRDSEYQVVFGRGLSIYYIVETVTTILAGYLYAKNAYIGLWIAFAMVIATILYAYLLKEPSKFQKRNVRLNAKTKNKNTPDSYLKIFGTMFFVATLIYVFIMRGVLSIAGTGFKIFLQNQVDFGWLSMELFGYIYALTRITAAITSKFQFKLDARFNIKTLIILSVFTILTFVLNGCLILFADINLPIFIIIVITSCIQYSITSPMRIFVNNYIRVCVDKKNIEKAQSIKTMADYLGYAAISAVFALLLEIFNDNYGLVCLVYIGIFAIPIILATIFFVRTVIKTHARKSTIVKHEYIE